MATTHPGNQNALKTNPKRKPGPPFPRPGGPGTNLAEIALTMRSTGPERGRIKRVGRLPGESPIQPQQIDPWFSLGPGRCAIASPSWERAADCLDRGESETLQALLTQEPGLTQQRHPETHQTLLLRLLNWPGGRPGRLDSAQLLLEFGADANVRTSPNSGETALHWAASNDRDADVIPLLTAAGAEVDALGGCIDGGTALLNAVHFGQTKAVAALVEAGAWTDTMRIAAGLGQIDKMSRWIAGDRVDRAAARVDPNGAADPGLLEAFESTCLLTSALHCAVFCEQFSAADWLLQRGAQPDLISPGCDSTLLHQVARRGRLSMARFLVERGADLNALGTTHPVSPFQYACAHAQYDMMNYLIDCGSRITLAQAAYCGRRDKVMQANPAEYDLELILQTIGGQTVLGRAFPPDFRAARLSVAQFLLQHCPQHEPAVRQRAQQANDSQYLEFLNQRPALDPPENRAD